MRTSSTRPVRRAVTVAAVGLGLLAGSVSTAGGAASPTGAVVRRPSAFGELKPLRKVAPAAPGTHHSFRFRTPKRPLPKIFHGPGASRPSSAPSVDAALDTTSVAAMQAPAVSFDGMNNTEGVVPPDTNGDIGPNHYVQTVNTRFAIYSRTGSLLYGPAYLNTIWSGLPSGSACRTSNDGDPIVLYDELADRWMISQFALPGSYYQCIAISKGPNPVSDGWHLYQYLISHTKLNDYPKFGVWPDAYYMSVNQFVEPNYDWGGAGAAAFDRTKMLAGDPSAAMVYFDVGAEDLAYGGMLPADVDGSTAPVAGAPGVFVEMDDNSWGWATDRLQVWNFTVNWSNPASSAFGQGPATNYQPNQVLNTAPFDSDLCGYTRCIQQPGTTRRLDPLSDRLLFRLAYRSFGSYESMAVVHSVDVTGTNRAGVRWYEVRRTGGPANPWGIFQQGTFSPDATNRWMGSIAIDEAGNMAMGYSVSKKKTPQVYPGIRYAGRLAGDPLGTMGQGEAVLINGSGVQTDPSGRWGDYASMSVDPVDDCTFWFTTEYYSATGSRSWRTRIGSFRFPGCT